MRVAIYARYSTDQQRDASIEDQFRLCRERAALEGWTVVSQYQDHAISGASMLRSGVQRLMKDASAKKFEIVLAEALDRLSRDQADIASFYKRMRFAEVEIVAHDDVANREPADQHLCHEKVGGEAGQRGVERQNGGHVEAHRVEQDQLARQRLVLAGSLR